MKFMKVIFSIVSFFCLLVIFYNNQNSKANQFQLNEPVINEEGLVKWDCIYFGNYWQEDTNGDGVADYDDEKTPIKWRILSIDGTNAFVLSEKNLLYMATYDGDSWENSDIRKTLNSSFYNAAFSDLEKNAILTSYVENESGTNTYDKLYLLSLYEVSNTKYGFNADYGDSQTRVSSNTEFVCNMQDHIEGIKQTFWFLRNRGISKYCILTIENTGCFDNNFGTEHARIRPCMHIDLSNSEWTKADDVYAEIGEIIPTSTPAPSPSPTPVPTPTPTAKPTETPPVSPTQTPDTADNSSPEPTDGKDKQPAVSTPPKTVSAPGRPTKLAVKNNKKKTVTVSWKKVKGANGYQIQYASNTAFSKKTAKSTKKTKLSIKKLKKKKTYCFRVRAYKTNNGVKKYGKWSKVKKVKIKK